MEFILSRLICFLYNITPLFREVGYTDDKKVVATFTIREKTEIEKRLDKLEKGQAVQDGAILELAGVVGGNA